MSETKSPVFAGATSAIRVRDSKWEKNTGVCVIRGCRSKSEALGALFEKLRHDFPAAEGWQAHDALVEEVEERAAEPASE